MLLMRTISTSWKGNSPHNPGGTGRAKEVSLPGMGSDASRPAGRRCNGCLGGPSRLTASQLASYYDDVLAKDKFPEVPFQPGDTVPPLVATGQSKAMDSTRQPLSSIGHRGRDFHANCHAFFR